VIASQGPRARASSLSRFWATDYSLASQGPVGAGSSSARSRTRSTARARRSEIAARRRAPTGGSRPQAERNLGIDPQGSTPTASSVNGRGRAGQDCAAQRRPRPSSRSRPARRPWGRSGDSRALEFSTRRCRMAPRAVGGGKRSLLSGADLGTISDLGSQNPCAALNSYS
jgi:hypothetical protein